MARRVIRTIPARRDLTRHYVYLGERDLDAAERFLEAYARGVRTLAEYPDIGSVRIFRHSKLTGVRMWSLPDFDKYLIFYHERKGLIRILRVLHSAEDYSRVFEDQS